MLPKRYGLCHTKIRNCVMRHSKLYQTNPAQAVKNMLLTFPEIVHKNFTKWKLSCFPALACDSFFYGFCMKQELFSDPFFYHFFFLFLLISIFFLTGNHNPGSILNTNFSHNQVEFSTDITKTCILPLGLTMFCRMPSRMGFSMEP